MSRYLDARTFRQNKTATAARNGGRLCSYRADSPDRMTSNQEKLN